MGKYIPQSSYPGKCKINPNHTYSQGDPIYYQKGENGTIICTEKACFEAQGGTVDQQTSFGSTTANKTNYSSKGFRTSQQRKMDVQDFNNDIMPIAFEKVSEWEKDGKFDEGLDPMTKIQLVLKLADVYARVWSR